MIVVSMTPGERLEMLRRRMVWTQPQAAEFFGLSVSRLRRFEQDDPPRRAVPLRLIGAGPRDCALSAREWCWLRRRRAGLTLAALADLSGMGARWVHHVETGVDLDLGPLVDFWKNCEL